MKVTLKDLKVIYMVQEDARRPCRNHRELMGAVRKKRKWTLWSACHSTATLRLNPYHQNQQRQEIGF